MITRRGLFSAITGRATFAAAGMTAAAEPAKAVSLGSYFCCGTCDCAMLMDRDWESGERWVLCPNEHCRKHGKRFKLPTVDLQELL